MADSSREHDSYRMPPAPKGGYLRAIPRDALTGEPIRPDTVKVRVHDLLAVRDTGPHGAPTRTRSRHARLAQPVVAELPTLILDDLTDDDESEDDEGQGDADDE